MTSHDTWRTPRFQGLFALLAELVRINISVASVGTVVGYEEGNDSGIFCKIWCTTPWNFNGWNLKMVKLKRSFIFQGSIFRFHVEFQKCISCDLERALFTELLLAWRVPSLKLTGKAPESQTGRWFIFLFFRSFSLAYFQTTCFSSFQEGNFQGNKNGVSRWGMGEKNPILFLGRGFRYFGIFTPILGVSWSNLTTIFFPSLPNTCWVDVWTPKHLLRRPFGVPNTSSKGIWRILED